MKQPTNHTILNRIAVLSIAALFLMNVSTAQEAKTFSSIQLSFYKNPDQSRTVIANVMQKDKKGGMMVYGKNVKINFYLEQSSGETLMGSAMTAVNGKAVYVLPADVASDETGKTSVTAKLENNELLADAESEASVKNAKLMMTLSEKDTLRQMTVKASELLRDGTEKPLPNMEVKFGVRRLFGIMPMGEESSATTDESGTAVFTFPKDINGDETGSVEIVARILDDENFGSIEASAKTQWGMQLVVDKNPFPRAIWEPKAPLWLIIAFSTVFGAIWFTYGYVVYTISKIDRLEKKKV